MNSSCSSIKAFSFTTLIWAEYGFRFNGLFCDSVFCKDLRLNDIYT